ncbi:hypothetical protein GCM10008164_52560 [Achromobacter xylosoxidans]|nr:hypothetical protein GCM10008164_52560 [Achromobacter xylosoxidans]
MRPVPASGLGALITRSAAAKQETGEAETACGPKAAKRYEKRRRTGKSGGVLLVGRTAWRLSWERISQLDARADAIRLLSRRRAPL